MWVRPEPTLMKHLSGAPLLGSLMTLLTNNRLGWLGLPGTNTLSYKELFYITVVKSFMKLTPEWRVGRQGDTVSFGIEQSPDLESML